MSPAASTLSWRGWQTVAWMLATSVQYGWHISALNQIQAALTCQSTIAPRHPISSLPPCIPMGDIQFSIVTSAFTVGGLLGSLGADRSMGLLGRKASICLNTLLILIGATLMTVSGTVFSMVLGRLFIGFGSGLGLCVVPAYLSEISPRAIKGSVGVLNQLGIVFGILFTQVFGIFLATPSAWRAIPLIAALMALLQLSCSFLAVDSPVWLSNKSRHPESRKSAILLWGNQTETLLSSNANLEEEGLLATDVPQEPDVQQSPKPPPTWPQLFKFPVLKPLVIACLGMLAQQLSGVNAVLYYSNRIFSGVLPQSASYVSLGITVVNVVMTFPPIYLIEKLGRRPLINISAIGAILSLFGIGYGLNSGYVSLSSIAVLTFVASFAIGLGPVPYIIISDVTPFYAIDSVSSIALSLNWIANFLVGLGFLPLRNLLANGDPSREGRVFYVFGLLLLFLYFIWSKMYVG